MPLYQCQFRVTRSRRLIGSGIGRRHSKGACESCRPATIHSSHIDGANAAFVSGMEDVLEVHQRPHDPACPVVCLDETSKQLIAETRGPITAKPGRAARFATSTSAMARPTRP